VKVVGRRRLYDFCQRHEGARGAVLAWIAEVEDAAWSTLHDLKGRYPSASFVGKNRVVFNLRGNRYRLDVKVSFQLQDVVIVRIGTHEEYDDWTF
jgi:mRNA interferase HigB